MSVSRREFLSGAAALGLGGWRLFAAPLGWKHGGKPNLVFGVLSDTHLRTANRGNRIGANWPDTYFAAALEYFKKQNVDAVYAAGCNMGIGHETNGGVTTLEIAKDELPPGESLTFAVRPLTSLGTSGRPIITDFKV